MLRGSESENVRQEGSVTRQDKKPFQLRTFTMRKSAQNDLSTVIKNYVLKCFACGVRVIVS